MKKLNEWLIFAVDNLDGKEIKSVNIYTETDYEAEQEFNKIFPNNRFTILRTQLVRTEEDLFQDIEDRYRGYNPIHDVEVR